MHAILSKMQGEWMGPSYDLLRKNCCSFSDAFCIELGVGPIPKWVHRLADAGAAIGDAHRAEVNMLHNLEERFEGNHEHSTKAHMDELAQHPGKGGGAYGLPVDAA